MLRATLKSLLARKLRLVLTALAVVLGVGFTAGTYVLTDTALKSFDDLFGNVYAGIDVVVQGTSAFTPTGGGGGGGGGGQETKPIPENVLPTVQAVDGVQTAAGSVSGLAQIVDPTTGKVIQNGGAPTIGNSWDPDTTSLEMVQGSGPSSPSQVAIDAGTATDHHLAVGQQIRIVTTAGPGRFTISGVVRFKASESLLGATLAVFDLPTAQRLFDREGQFDLIYVRGQSGVNPGQLATSIGAVLPKGFEAITAASAAQQQQDQVNQG
ncbi:MAG TPA: ABC transporter permease, partial [Actinomycetota bacterium]|nr:ABC transporter permease [Actinomycetota bacterium]